MKKLFKNWFYKIFDGMVVPVMSTELKGIRLRINKLLPVVIFYKSVEKENFDVYNKLISPGDVVFDIGANVGLHSCYFAKKFKNISIYSFEPVEENFNYFLDTIKLNSLQSIHPIKKAVGAKTGVTYFDRSSNNHQGHITDTSTDYSVQIVSLDDFISAEAIEPDFIKVDVEGAESEVLAGFINNIATTKACLLIEIHTQEQGKLVSDFFALQPFMIYRFNNPGEVYKNGAFTLLKDESKQLSSEQFWGKIVAIPFLRKDKIAALLN
jgi:FkbM family methyltransferase